MHAPRRPSLLCLYDLHVYTCTYRCLAPDVAARGAAARARCARRTRWRSYATFAYLFAASPPFGLAAVSPAFRLRLRVEDNS